MMKLINGVLFQITWFACVIGSAHGFVWPALLSCAILAAWQLAPSRRHASDILLVVVSIMMGLLIDTLWIQIGFFEFTDQRPFTGVAPLWIIVLWIGFALTINHSLAWLKTHPLLPAAMGLIGAPMSYLAGLKLGAINYLGDTLLISSCLGIAWAIALIILVRLSQLNPSRFTQAIPQ